MKANEIRKSFLDFFKSKEHRIVPSAPVVPHGDPTLLFTNAGMNQFKDVFLGAGTRDYSRAADTQKCIRVSGKHNDLEEVGVDTYHHTLFEMLGNWSFGDYYKEEAIAWAWELLVHNWGLDIERIHATVYRTDDEAYEIWKKYLPKERIHRFDEEDNFWEMGDTGPCGPCSEIHYDRTPDKSGGNLVNAGVQEVIEIWNLVFIQFNRKADGTLQELTNKHVDTGMGFERIVSVLQGKESNYDTDVFMPLLNKISVLSGKEYKTDLDDPDSIAMRVISDHIRTLSFAIADGALPGNEGRSYVLRRILRRASRFSRNLGFKEAMIYKLVPTLVETMAETFPEIKENQSNIEKVIKSEEESFLQTLERGLERFEQIAEKEDSKTISGEDTFQLYDTFGFPVDLTELIAREKGFKVDIKGFEAEMQKQKERSRAARKVHSQEVELPVIKETTEFIGYADLVTDAKIVYTMENMLVLDKSPFYVESGGQISDTGSITYGGTKYKVIDVKKSGDAIFHVTDKDVEPLVGETAHAEVDNSRRKDIMRNHSATHLLHEALRRVLGDHIKQAGSLVAPDYLRFDFTHFEKVSKDELSKIENLVNEEILKGIDVQTQTIPIEEAEKNPKIRMFFGDKYGDEVRLVTMDSSYSMELCGGTHVSNTSEIGLFKITSESSVAAGVRRIEAITGRAVNEYINNLHEKLSDKDLFANELNNKIKQLEKDLATLKMQDAAKDINSLIESATKVGEINVVTDTVDVDTMDQLRDLADEIRGKMKENGIALFAKIEGEKVQLVCAVTDDIKGKYPAGKLVGAAAKMLGGGGGGKPHLATAGGRDVTKIDDLMKEFPKIVENFA